MAMGVNRSACGEGIVKGYKFKFAIGDMIKSKDNILTLLVLGYQEESDVLLPCYNVYELDRGVEREWSCRYIEEHYKAAN